MSNNRHRSLNLSSVDVGLWMDEHGNPEEFGMSGTYTVHIKGFENILKLQAFLNQHIPDTNEQVGKPEEL